MRAAKPRDAFEDLSVGFGMVIDGHGKVPEVRAAEITASARDGDPKVIADMIGGSKDGAEKLGLI